MYIKIFIVLLGLFFFQANAQNPVFFQPNFNASPLIIPQGSNLLPLCSNPADPFCMYQWSQQAMPLGIYPSAGADYPDLYQYFLPTFMSSETVEKDSIESDDWELWSFSRKKYRSDKKPAQKIYRSKSDPNQFAIETKDDEGNTTIHKGHVNFVPVENIEKGDEGYTTNTETVAVPAQAKEDEQGQSRKDQKPQVAEVQEGCLVIEKPEEKTEADFCVDCKKSEDVASSLFSNWKIFETLKNYFKKTEDYAIKRVSSQIGSSPDSVEKICSPESTLKNIIRNFNRTCPEPYKNKFNDFFKKTYCESCKKGVPPEIMMAMMSIESAGRCQANALNSNEHSIGLFQINARVHGCLDQNGKSYKRRSSQNLQCLENPENNLNKGISILVDHYKKVNPNNLNKSSCQSWLSITSEERDSWRRGVSAYNGGPKWVTRAIKAAYDQRTLQDTSYLTKVSNTENYKHKNVAWEDLRAYYFIETLSPKNKRGTGRKLRYTLSNLAHTEAVLGRDIKTPYPAMVEIWAQYVNKNRAQCQESEAPVGISI